MNRCACRHLRPPVIGWYREGRRRKTLSLEYISEPSHYARIISSALQAILLLSSVTCNHKLIVT